MYQIVISHYDGTPIGVNTQQSPYTVFIPFAPDNTDYQNFKSQINADEAELQDADGNLMSPEEAKAFVKELP
jgi:hypothetical protein